MPLRPSVTLPPCPWAQLPADRRLRRGEVDLVCARLDLPERQIDQLVATLSDEERQRASRFRAGTLRNRYIAGRGLLRSLLARYLDVRPAELRFDYLPQGKPVLAGPLAESGLRFNVSHSHDIALVGIAAGLEIGVDVEMIREMRDMGGMVRRFFAPGEQRQWEGLPEHLRPHGFFLGWTRKEAWLKATGTGLSFPLDRFCVSLLPGEPAALLSIEDDPARAASWWLDTSEPCDGCVAAAALPKRPSSIHRWRWE